MVLPPCLLGATQLPGQDGLSLTRQLRSGSGARFDPGGCGHGARHGERSAAESRCRCVGQITKPYDTNFLAEQVAAFLQAPPSELTLRGPGGATGPKGAYVAVRHAMKLASGATVNC